MSILSHIKGFVQGAARGGVGGALSGLVAGQNNAPSPHKLKRQAMAAQGATGMSAPAQVAQMPVINAAYSPQVLAPLPQTGSFSASNLVRYADVTAPTSNSFFSGGGASGSWLSPVAPTTPSGRAGGPGSRAPYWTWGTDAFGRPVRVSLKTGKPIKRRRLNPMNYRAARRAVRRIKGARHLLQRIERTLPKSHTRRRAA